MIPITLALVIAMTSTTTAPAAPPELGALYAAARSYDKATFRWKRPSDSQLQQMRSLVQAVVRALGPGQPPPRLVAQALAAGFELTVARDPHGPVWTLHEPAGVRAGGGLYAFRPRGQGQPVCIQAPHTFFDQGTGDIALALFARLPADCLFVNTVHRYSAAATEAPAADSPAEPDAEHPADVAHAAATWFAAANQGALDAAPFTIVQVHGFGAGPEARALHDVRAIVADGQNTRAPDAPAVRLRAALAARLGAGKVRLFGADADVLGATTNVQGKAARKAGAVFLHVEMSGDTRRALGADVSPLEIALRETLAPPPAKPTQRR
jgi:hypothetical protein